MLDLFSLFFDFLQENYKMHILEFLKHYQQCIARIKQHILAINPKVTVWEIGDEQVRTLIQCDDYLIYCTFNVIALSMFMSEFGYF